MRERRKPMRPTSVRGGLDTGAYFSYTPPAPGAQVAQLVEQGTENPRVGSSILSLGTIFSLVTSDFLDWVAPCCER